MEEKLLEKLNDGETLLWSAKPEPFETLDQTHKAHFIKKAVLIAVVFAVIVGGYLIAAAKNGVTVQLSVILIGLAVALFGVFRDFLDANKLRNKAVYGLTDQRMIAMMGLSFDSVEYDYVTDFDFLTDEDGHVSLLCGERARKEKPYNRRSATVCGTRTNSDNGMCESFAMYGVTGEVEAIREILSQYIETA